jgi:hypothetical protein
MKVLWRQLIIVIFYGVCLFTAFIYGTYWGVRNHSPAITPKDLEILEQKFIQKCES